VLKINEDINRFDVSVARLNKFLKSKLYNMLIDSNTGLVITSQYRAATLEQVVHIHVTLYVGVSGLVVEYRTRNFHVTGANLVRAINKLLTYCVLRPTQPPTLSGAGNK